MSVKFIKGLTQGLTKGLQGRLLLGVAYSRLSDNAEYAKEKGTRKVLYYFRVALSQFSGPDYLGAWNRLIKGHLRGNLRGLVPNRLPPPK